MVAILGDQTDIMYSFFRDGGGKDEARTIVAGNSTGSPGFESRLVQFSAGSKIFIDKRCGQCKALKNLAVSTF